VAADRRPRCHSEGELFVVGRIKDLLIVDGRNHYPDDIETTIQEITGGPGRGDLCADDRTEQLVTIIELRKWGKTADEAMDKLRTVKREVTSAVSKSHGLRVADLVLVASGSIPITPAVMFDVSLRRALPTPRIQPLGHSGMTADVHQEAEPRHRVVTTW